MLAQRSVVKFYILSWLPEKFPSQVDRSHLSLPLPLHKLLLVHSTPVRFCPIAFGILRPSGARRNSTSVSAILESPQKRQSRVAIRTLSPSRKGCRSQPRFYPAASVNTTSRFQHDSAGFASLGLSTVRSAITRGITIRCQQSRPFIGKHVAAKYSRDRCGLHLWRHRSHLLCIQGVPQDLELYASPRGASAYQSTTDSVSWRNGDVHCV